MASDGLWVRTGRFPWVLQGTLGLVGWSVVIWGPVSAVYRYLGLSGDAGDCRDRGFKAPKRPEMASDGLLARTDRPLWVLPGTWGLVGWSRVIWGPVNGVCRYLGLSKDAGDGRHRGFKLQNGRKWPLVASGCALAGFYGYCRVLGG